MTSKLTIRFIVAADKSYSKPGSVNRTFECLDMSGTCANESTREMSVLLLENWRLGWNMSPPLVDLDKKRRSKFGDLDGKLFHDLEI